VVRVVAGGLDADREDHAKNIALAVAGGLEGIDISVAGIAPRQHHFLGKGSERCKLRVADGPPIADGIGDVFGNSRQIV